MLFTPTRQSIVSTISAEDLSRFKTYARRVFYMVYSADILIHPSVYDCVLQLSGDQPLLPSLRRIDWIKFPQFEPHMLAFICPSLRSATIGMTIFPVPPLYDPHNGDYARGINALLDALSSRAPLLELLAFEGTLSVKATTSIVLLKHLRFLDLTMAGSWDNEGTFVQLGTLPVLLELRVNIAGLEVKGPTPLGLFRALQVLEVTGNPTSISSVISCIYSEVLRDVFINSTYSYPPAAWRNCVKRVATKFFSLREFRLKLLRGDLSLSRTSDDAMRLIEPLLKASQLQVIVVDLEGPLRLSDADIHTMATHWKALRAFHFWCHRSGDGPTLQSVASCTTHCSQLRLLELPADAIHSDTPPTDAVDLPSLSLEEITLLGNIKIEDKKTVAARLKKLCPRLVHFEAYSWDPQVNAALADMKCLIPTLQRRGNKKYRVL